MLNDSDSSWVTQRMIEAISIVEAELTRPVVLFKPRIYRDGAMWCCLYGDNIQEGIVGFGESPDKATREFDIEWTKR